MNNEELALTIKNISIIIRLLYKRLYILEINKKKDSLEYNKILELIKFYTKLEDGFYNIIFTSKSCDDILDINTTIVSELGYNVKIGCFLNDDALINGLLSEDEIIIMRCVRNLFIIFARLDSKDPLDGSVNYMIEKTNNERNNIFLHMISEEEDSTELIKSKYDFSFVFKDDEYIKHNDIIGEVGVELKISDDITRIGRILCSIVDEVLCDSSRIYILSSYIKSSLCFMNEEDVYIIRDVFETYVDLGIVEDGYGYRLFIQLLDEYESIKKDYLDGGFNLKRKY